MHYSERDLLDEQINVNMEFFTSLFRSFQFNTQQKEQQSLTSAPPSQKHNKGESANSGALTCKNHSQIIEHHSQEMRDVIMSGSLDKSDKTLHEVKEQDGPNVSERKFYRATLATWLADLYLYFWEIINSDSSSDSNSNSNSNS